MSPNLFESVPFFPPCETEINIQNIYKTSAAYNAFVWFTRRVYRHRVKNPFGRRGDDCSTASHFLISGRSEFTGNAGRSTELDVHHPASRHQRNSELEIIPNTTHRKNKAFLTSFQLMDQLLDGKL